MKPHEILLLGLKQSVMAFSRADGSVHWTTKLEGGTSGAFVTLASDARHVFATCHGVLHCLDLQTGSLLWTDPLKGCGYGIGSLCLPEQGSPSAAGAAAYVAAQDAAAAAAASSSAAAAT